MASNEEERVELNGTDLEEVVIERRRVAPAFEPTRVRGREVLLAITVFFMTSLCIGLIVCLTTVKPAFSTAEGRRQELCEDESCLKSSVYITSKANFSVDPCENFYNYACGKFEKKKAFGDQVDDEILAEVNQRLRKVIENPKQKDSVVEMYKLLYETCLKSIERKDRNQTEDFRNILKDLGGWPILGSSSGGKKNIDLQELLQRVYELRHTDLFYITVSESAFQEKKQVIKVLTAVQILENNYEDLTDIIKKMKQAAISLGSTLTGKEIEEQALKVATLRKEIYQIASKTHITEKEQTISVSRLHEQSKEINWLDLLKLFDKSLTVKSIIELSPNLEYYGRLSELWRKTDRDTLINFLLWNILLYYSEKMKDISSPFSQNSNEKESWKKCVNVVTYSFSSAIGCDYSKTYGGDSKNIRNIIESIRSVMKQKIEEASWMDDKTKKRAVTKLKKLTYNLACEEQFTLGNKKRINFYKHINLKPSDSYIAMLKKQAKFEMFKIQKQIKSGRRTEWAIYLFSINAVYHFQQNWMAIAAPLLTEPFYSKTVPRYINYAKLGTVIGHEITHAFDDQGSQFDENGSLKNWWDDSTLQIFRQRVDCIKSFYANKTFRGLSIFNEQSLAEHISDIGGIRLAYEAFTKEKTHKILPGSKLPSSEEQIFFLSYAQNFCSKEKESTTKTTITIGQHLPASLRVLYSLQQVPEFSKAFNCKDADEMKAREQCSVW
ncbi:DgyrCDS4532 [Dimorphilus gyrociliatus]|uniref:DgyrCDS4532 n=1 Tax=Dimorphilus gyrociliatus TaxID=2664684 RepID=A0A7I8VLW6_9ANNE|nr:DgyrCDS4532 [Dimorphilus gyrociliatus]